MRKTVSVGILGILALCLGSTAMAEPSRLDGHWEGVIVVKPGEFEVDMKLDVVKTPDGSLTGHLSYPNQGHKEYRLDTVQMDEENFLITSIDEQKVVSVFQGRRLDGGSLLSGDLTEGGRKAPFELHRTDSAVFRIPPTVQILSPGLAELKTLFNRDQERVRVLLILSPTCSICRMGARLIERHLLEQIRDPGLTLYVVWEKIGPQDTQAMAVDAATLLSDNRIQHFWSPDHLASTAFQSPVGIQHGTAWDVFLVFDKGKKWTDEVPAFDSFMHNQKLHEELPKDRLLNAEKLSEEIKGLLGTPAPAASR